MLYMPQGGDFKKDFPERKKKENNKQVASGEADLVLNGYEKAEVFTISSQDAAKEWILDSECLFHMCPNRTWFQTFN